MDVQAPELRIGGFRISWFAIGTVAILLLAAALRYKGIHNPMLDHPNWRQGDTASIARNFARLQFNPMYPQTNYNGPPPNYVELELQIVPFLAATLYKIFGIHEIFGRFITLALSLATVAILSFFGRWLLSSWPAGLAAALAYAIMPGSIYYGRTFTPDCAMVFFLTAALYAVARFLVEDEALSPRALARSTALLIFAYLAKPVAVLGIVPVIAMVWERSRAGRTLRATAVAVLLFVPLFILYFYERRVASQAEWHWASGIMQLHVLPALLAAFSSAGAFGHKLSLFWQVLGMLARTMIGHFLLLLALLGAIALPFVAVRTRLLLWWWLAAGLAYVFVVVTVERVDYYMFPLLPLAALFIGALTVWCVQRLQQPAVRPAIRIASAVVAAVAIVLCILQSRDVLAPYYHYNRQAYRNAIALSQELDPNALVVMGHYGPDVLYYIDRFGWQEDPYLWTPFDEESAIGKGARYFISIEDNRLRKNLELCAWLQRFPLLNSRAQWPVYHTDPALELPGAQAFWRAFRAAEKAGQGRQFLDAHNVCKMSH